VIWKDVSAVVSLIVVLPVSSSEWISELPQLATEFMSIGFCETE
jgi:hypothetical protein